MSQWDRSMFALSGSEYEIQETLQTMRRLLTRDSVRSTTRVVLEGAVLVLENELALQAESRDH